MKESDDKYLENLSKKVMTDVGKESPSSEFTSIIMSKILVDERASLTTYTPLISKTGWITLLTGFALFLLFIVLNTQQPTLGWFNNFNTHILKSFNWNITIPTISVSKTASYAIILFAIMLCIQITYIKHYLDKPYKQ